MNREQWLNESANLIWHEILEPHTATNKPKFRVSVAPLNQSTLGQCHPTSLSKDSTNEIFIASHTDDSLHILSTLQHELIHASDDCQSGHRNHFAKLARQSGLIGRLTATTASPQLEQRLNTITELLGPIPHATLVIPPKQKGRNNSKIVCYDCQFQANLSNKWVQRVNQNFECPCCTSTNTGVITK